MALERTSLVVCKYLCCEHSFVLTNVFIRVQVYGCVYVNPLTVYCVSYWWDGIGTGYGLDGPGIESRWGVRFSEPVQTGPGAHPASYTMRIGSFPGV
jgi:hypothetical protein